MFVSPEGNLLLPLYRRHPERSEGPLYFAFAVARPLFVIPQRICLSFRSAAEESASASALAFVSETGPSFRSC
jgi:hypothetical protein